MRSIIFISAVALLVGPVAAQGLPPGCYVRDYSAAHLAKHPAQVVGWIRLKVFKDAYGDTVADLDAAVADQGHAAGSGLGGQVLGQALHCWESGGQTGCSVECDGGWFTVQRSDAESLTIRTEYLLIGDVEGCGGALDLAEVPGQPVSYRLDRIDDGYCEEN